MKLKNFLKSRAFKLIILLVMAFVTVLFGSLSYSKYEINYKDQIVAEYADFCLSHDGEGKSTILSTVSGSGDYAYTGFMSVSVNNTREKDGDIEISSRLIEFTMRTPTASEITDKAIYDVWGQKVADVAVHTSNYDVSLVNEYGNPIGDNITLGTENNVAFDSKKVNLVINRKKSATPATLDGIEYITVVIKTTKPYSNTIPFTIAVSNRKILFTTTTTDYFGFEDIKVNLVTSNNYSFGTGADLISNNPVKVELTYTDSALTFDYERFKLSVEGNLLPGTESQVFSNYYYYTGGKIILYLKPGSDIDLHFYVIGATYSIQAAVYFDMDENKSIETGADKVDIDYTSQCAGLSSGFVIKKS